jgi:hypothetical protein
MFKILHSSSSNLLLFDLAVGFENGSVRILNTEDLSDYHELLSTSNSPPQAPFPYNSTNMTSSNKMSRHSSIIVSKHAIVRLAFSNDEEYLATADAGFGVTVIRREPIAGQVPIKSMSMVAPAAGPLSTKVVSTKKGSLTGKATSTPPAPVPPQPAANSETSKIKAKVQWVFCGRNQAHYKEITGKKNTRGI